MSWKTETMLRDMDADRRIEMTCRACGKLKVFTTAALLARGSSGTLFLDQIEWAESCRDKHCGGRIRLSLSHNQKAQAFVAGMP